MELNESFEKQINRSDYKILIVDDVVSNVLLLKILLTSEKFQVCTANCGNMCIEQAKKEKEAKKNQRVIEIKEIRMSPGIDTNDFNTKLKNGQKFLSDGDRVKVSVRFRGREMAHTDIGAQLLKDFAEKCAEIANMDKAPKLEGRNMSMFLSPKPVTPPKKPAKPKAPKTETPVEG